ncbi:MAG: diguanylate cyclase, partial [Bacillota bacterium]|nr:diguanylate cyclase [Bacillota bacterium]
MIGFGILIGVIFPFFALAMNVPAEFALDPLFFSLCVVAGIVVGAVNVFLARRVVARRIKTLSKSMRHVESMISLRATTSKYDICDVDACSVPVLSDDDLGDTARAFNALIQSLSDSYKAEADLQTFNGEIASQLDLSSISAFALDTIVRKNRAAGGALLVERNGELDVTASRSLLNPEHLSDNPVLWRVLKTGISERIAFPVDVDVDAVISTFRPRELLVIPILYKKVPLGLLLLAGSMQFPHNAISGIEAFTAGLSLALKNALTHVQLQELAATDPLTSIYNRRFGLMRLQEEYNRAIRLGSPVGVMMCDIDHFKAVNDTYGHVVGDKVLLSVAKAIKTALREGDLAVRYGGEE